MSVTLELRRQRQEEQKFKVSICYITSSRPDWVTYITPSLKQTNRTHPAAENRSFLWGILWAGAFSLSESTAAAKFI